MTEFKNYYGYEVKDVDTKKGEILMKHATFNGIDRVDDTIEDTAFEKQYKSINAKDIGFFFNHYDDQVIGETKKVFTDKEAAYTLAAFGKDPLGQAIMELSLNGGISGVSMGYIAEKKEYTYKGSKRVRKLKSIRHLETSLLTKIPADPRAGIVDIKAFVGTTTELIHNIESFCRTTRKAPDSLIRHLQKEVKQMRQELAEYSIDDFMDDCERLEQRLEAERKDIQNLQKQIFIRQIKNML